MTTVRDVMTTDLVTCSPETSIADAARMMRDHAIGDVLVTVDGELRGIATDRDLVIRCLADGASASTAIAEACSDDPATVSPTATIEDAVQLMRDLSLRRLPVVDGRAPIGIVTLGDLAMDRDPRSVLGDISAARPNT